MRSMLELGAMEATSASKTTVEGNHTSDPIQTFLIPFLLPFYLLINYLLIVYIADGMT